MLEPSALKIITDCKTSGQVYSFSQFIWPVSFVGNFQKNGHDQLKQKQSGKQLCMQGFIFKSN